MFSGALRLEIKCRIVEIRRQVGSTRIPLDRDRLAKTLIYSPYMSVFFIAQQIKSAVKFLKVLT